jgi:hypothetical protein
MASILGAAADSSSVPGAVSVSGNGNGNGNGSVSGSGAVGGWR